MKKLCSVVVIYQTHLKSWFGICLIFAPLHFAKKRENAARCLKNAASLALKNIPILIGKLVRSAIKMGICSFIAGSAYAVEPVVITVPEIEMPVATPQAPAQLPAPAPAETIAPPLAAPSANKAVKPATKAKRHKVTKHKVAKQKKLKKKSVPKKGRK